VTTSDPIRYPLPRGNAESLRQDIVRTRAALTDTLDALGGRLAFEDALRRQVDAVLAATVPPVAAAVVAAITFVAVHQLRRPPARARGAVALAVSASAGLATFVALRRTRHAPPGPTPASVVDRKPTRPPALRPSPRGGDVVDVLLAQHRRVDELFAGVTHAPNARRRREAFALLVEYLNHHEHAEQSIVHPALREIGAPAAAVVDGRLAEEEAADRALASLISHGVNDRRFEADLAELQRMVHEHAAHEEAQEFPLLRAHLDVARLQQMAGEIQLW
jgi:hemerythrin superfamily protein